MAVFVCLANAGCSPGVTVCSKAPAPVKKAEPEAEYAVVEYRIQLGATACRFARGHRIRLEVTSSDFPNHDRNHNFGHNDLEEVEMARAEQRVLHGKGCASRLLLPVRTE